MTSRGIYQVGSIRLFMTCPVRLRSGRIALVYRSTLDDQTWVGWVQYGAGLSRPLTARTYYDLIARAEGER